MTIIRRLLPFAVAIATVATILAIMPANPTRRGPLAVPEREDPRAGVERELLRTRDPATGRIPEGIRRRELAFASTLPSRDVDALLRVASGPVFSWQGRGPSNVGGRTRALAFDVSDHSVMLAGGVTGGMWRSSDRGLSWRRTTLPAQLPSATCLAQDRRPGHTSTWYYGTGEYRTNSTRFGNVLYAGDGIFKSTDGGLSFAQLPSTVASTPDRIDQPFDFVSRIAIDPSNLEQDEVYAAAMGTIMRSVDGGATWQTALGEFDGVTGYTDVAVDPNGVVYATIGQGSNARGIWRSEDGVRWDRITPSGWGDSCRRSAIAIAPSDPDVVYFFGHTPGAGRAIPGIFEVESLSLWRYDDGAWDDRSMSVPDFGEGWSYTSLSGYAFHIAVHPTQPATVLLGGSNLYVSTNGFDDTTRTQWLGGYSFDWNYGEDGSLHPDQHIALFDPDDASVIYAGSDGGVYRSDDWDMPTPTWEQRNTGYVTTQFYTVAIDPWTAGSQQISAGAQDNGTLYTRVDDPSAPWDWVVGGDGAFSQFGSEGRVRFASSQYDGLVRDTLDAAGGILQRNYLYGPRTGSMFVNPYTLDHSNHSVLYYAAGRGLARTNDPAAEPTTWVALSRTRYQSGGYVSAVSSTWENPAHRVWYGTADGRLWRLDGANTGSPAPVDVASSQFPQNAYINCIAVDPLDGGRAVVVFSNYGVVSLFLTDDAGATWTPIAGNLEQNPDGTGSGPSCRWAEFLHTPSGPVLFVGTTTGLYSTTAIDGMNTIWRQEGAATIGNVIVDMVATRQLDGFVAVATWGNGVFAATADIGGVADGGASDAALLGAVAPNPARTSAVIPYSIPDALASREVRLTLVDIAGREIALVASGRPGAGEHRARVDLGGLAPGAYYYRITVGGVTQTRPLMIAR